jgi:hypothetical protein
MARKLHLSLGSMPDPAQLNGGMDRCCDRDRSSGVISVGRERCPLASENLPLAHSLGGLFSAYLYKLSPDLV